MPELWATKDSVVALNGADLTLRGPMGDLRCNVSTERINRMTRNPFKDLRERGYADQFLLALRAQGAAGRLSGAGLTNGASPLR